ncbi:MAG: T9SS type A sorting domain-containing protein [candidate division KSB1 bacterium]|nr:T9SS type A sorting domain-containing protein [candidate division KSB1 bacterium]
MRKIGLTLVAMAVLVSAAVAQWEFDSEFCRVSLPHGVVITPDNKVWVAAYGRTDTMRGVAASVPLIYDLEGNLIQKLRVVTFQGQPDTLWNRARGISLDKDGHVLYSAFDVIYHINYQTLEAMHKIQPAAGKSVTEAAMDANGYVYVCNVAAGNPGYIYDPDFELFSYFADTVKTLQRSVIVTPDGKDVYVGAIYSGPNGVLHYHSDDGPEGTYTLVGRYGTIMKGDTVVRNMWGQCLDWDPWGMIWVGTYWDVGANDFKSWYQLDPKREFAIVDSLSVPAGNPSVDPVPPEGNKVFSPRGIAFYQKDNVWYALAADFDGNIIKRFKNPSPYTGLVEVVNSTVVRHYGLMQNYPNPFNPTTTIPFVLAKPAEVELKVYDIMGREVRTLLHERMGPGEHRVLFDATGHPSGHYFYRLKVDGKVLTRTMTLAK